MVTYDDYSLVIIAQQALKEPNRCICIYCHAQALTEEEIVHEHDCPGIIFDIVKGIKKVRKKTKTKTKKTKK
jgi:hypothetical protein